MEVMAVVDRVEGDLAVLEIDGVTVDWPLRLLPGGVGEGATLRITVARQPGSTDDAEARLARLRARSPDSTEFDL